MGRYFPAEEPALERSIDEFLLRLRGDLEAGPFAGCTRALVLAGGYGRGEGGVFRPADSSAPRLYNDLEFYWVFRGAVPGESSRQCAAWAHEGERDLGIEIEFKRLGERALWDAAPSLFYHDLAVGGRVVAGDAEWFAGLPERLRDPARIPLHEVTRLLFNRGSSLFFAQHALEHGTPRATDGYVERVHAKLMLALGDAVLAACGRHHVQCRERHARLGQVPGDAVPADWAQICSWHAEGVRFKFHPRHLSPPEGQLLAGQSLLREVWLRTFLWIERRRLGLTLSDAAAYAGAGVRLLPEFPAWRNPLLRLRDWRSTGSCLPGWLDYPRAPLQRALVLALSGASATASARWLNVAPAAGPSAIHDAYRGWWLRYN